VALDNTGYGIYAIYGCTLSGCAARGNTGTGIYASPYCSLSGCAAHGNTGTGIYASDGCTLGGCEASHNNNGDGIYASQGCTLSDCATSYNFSDGIEIYSDNRVVNCVCYGNGWFGDGAGIHATSSDNRIEGNSVTDNDRGIDVDLAGNFIVRNSASGNTLNWDVAAGNVCLVVQATTAGAISGNSGGTAPGSTDPNANFTY
jgi:parallel beta-helix repeat protein